MKHHVLFLGLISVFVLICGCEDLNFSFPPYNESKNYCGPEGLFSVPRGAALSDADFNNACYNHDKCYFECETNGKTQADCDNTFKQMMDDACDQEYDRQMNICDQRSGWNPFKYTCAAEARIATSACWTQAATYYKTVSAGGKAIGAYSCKE